MSADLDRLLALLEGLLKERALTYCQLEQRLGWAAGTLSRLMSGGRQIKLRQFLDILRATNVRPSRFFQIVENPDTPFLTWPLTEAELEAWIERAVQRALAGQPKSD